MTEKRTPEEAQMEKYILGEMSDAERETFEEKFIESEEFFARALIVENELVDSYANETFTGDKLVKFERNYLTTHEKRKKVENARTLQTFFERQQEEALEKAETPVIVAAQEKPSLWDSIRAFFSPQGVALQYGMAVVLLAVTIAGIWLFVDRSRLKDELAQTKTNQTTQKEEELEKQIAIAREKEQDLQKQIGQQKEQNNTLSGELDVQREQLKQLEKELNQLRQRQSNPSENIYVATLIRVRGEDVKTLKIPQTSNLIRLQIPLLVADETEFKNYEVSLNQNSAQIVGSGSQKLSNTRLILNVPSKLLVAGDYVVFVKGKKKDGSVQTLSELKIKVERE